LYLRKKLSKNLPPVSVNTPISGDPSTIINRTYDDEFLSALGAKFKFDAHTTAHANEIRRIGENYIIYRQSAHEDVQAAKSQKSYCAFLNVTDQFLTSLQEAYKNPDFYNIATEMQICARGRDEPEPQKEFPKLSEHQRTAEAHYRELVRLTELLKGTLIQGIARSKRKRGPKPDPALEYLVKLGAVFWTLSLEHEFTLDYHKGSGHTPAFYFVQALLSPLEDVGETKIVTAMRAEIKELRKHQAQSKNIKRRNL
jgi:hypothetical protein